MAKKPGGEISQKARVLACACDLYLQGGMPAVSMRKIAAKLHLTPMALYRHYKNKQTLISALVDEGFRVFVEYQMRALTGANAAERLRLVGQAYLDFGLEHSRYYQVLFMAPESYSDIKLPKELVGQAKAAFHFLGALLGDAMNQGYLAKDDTEKLTTAFWGLSHGLISLYLIGMLEKTEDEFRVLFFEALKRFGIGNIIDGT